MLFLAEQILSSFASLSMSLLLIRQIDITYLGQAQIVLIPALFVSAFVTNKYYLPIASLIDENEKLNGFFRTLKIIIFYFIVSIFILLFTFDKVNGIALGLPMAIYLIATEYSRYFLIAFRRASLITIVTSLRFTILLSSLIFFRYFQDINLMQYFIWPFLLIIATIPSLISAIICFKSLGLNLLNIVKRTFGSFAFSQGGSSSTYSLFNCFSGFINSSSLAFCGASEFAAYNAFHKSLNIFNPAIQLIELHPRSNFAKFAQSQKTHIFLLILVSILILPNTSRLISFIFGQSLVSYSQLFLFVLPQILFACFCRLLGSRLRIVCQNSNLIFKKIGYVMILISLVNLGITIMLKSITISIAIINIFYFVQYFKLIFSISSNLRNSPNEHSYLS